MALSRQLKYALPLFLIILLGTSYGVYTYALSVNTFTVSPGIYPGAPTYTIYKDGGFTYAKNDYGVIVQSSASSYTTLQNIATYLGANSGTMYVKAGIYDLGTTSLNILLQESSNNPKPFQLVGEGANTIFRYSGTGYAINVTTIYSTYQWVTLKDFAIDCITKTSGRSGLVIKNIGRSVILDHIKINNVDQGITYNGDGVNQVYAYNCRVVTCNVGFTNTRAENNELAFYSCEVIGSASYGFLIQSGTNIRLYSTCVSASSGYSYYLNGTWACLLDGTRSEGNAIADIYVKDSLSVEIRGTYLNGGGTTPHGIVFDGSKEITISTLRSRLHTGSTFYFLNNTNSVTVINPNNEDPATNHPDPYMFDSQTLTLTVARNSGTIIDGSAQGVIICGGENIIMNNLVSLGGGDILAYNATSNYVAISQILGVAMYNSSGSLKSTAVCTSGIIPIKVDTTVQRRDILVAGSTPGLATVNNSETRTNYILGYAVTGSASGYCYVKIGA